MHVYVWAFTLSFSAKAMVCTFNPMHCGANEQIPGAVKLQCSSLATAMQNSIKTPGVSTSTMSNESLSLSPSGACCYNFIAFAQIQPTQKHAKITSKVCLCFLSRQTAYFLCRSAHNGSGVRWANIGAGLAPQPDPHLSNSNKWLVRNGMVASDGSDKIHIMYQKLSLHTAPKTGMFILGILRLSFFYFYPLGKGNIDACRHM
jgi:hypothetical protein